MDHPRARESSVAAHVLGHPHLVPINCLFRNEHLTPTPWYHVGSHMMLLKQAVEAQNGRCLQEVFRAFWRALGAQPNWSQAATWGSGSARMQVMLLRFCANGHHRSEACLWLLMWNWFRIGGSLVNDHVAIPYLRLSREGHTSRRCGNGPCPDRSENGCDAWLIHRSPESAWFLRTAAQLFDDTVATELQIPHGSLDLRDYGLDEFGQPRVDHLGMIVE